MGRLKPPENKPFRVLFVCVGNAIRSQMAEAFARKYGSDVIHARSCGIAPASTVMPLTRVILSQRGIDIGDAYPKGLHLMEEETFDYVINISGTPLRVRGETVLRDWKVADPMGEGDARYEETAGRIEQLVMQLILELRGKRRQAPVAETPVSPAFDVRMLRRARG